MLIIGKKMHSGVDLFSASLLMLETEPRCSRVKSIMLGFLDIAFKRCLHPSCVNRFSIGKTPLTLNMRLFALFQSNLKINLTA